MEYKLITVNTENSIVGEGPMWDARGGRFMSLDIVGKRVYIVASDGSIENIDLPQQVGCMALCENGDMLLAMEDGVYRRTPDGKLTKAHQDIKIKGRRFNDGKIGPDGAFYLGTTDPDWNGAFYRLRDGVLTELFDGCNCSNGIEWTADKTKMYYIDTPKQMVEIFDFDEKTGELSNRRTFKDIPKELGKPDGMTLDVGDDLWVALWDGHKVLHIDKDTKEIVDTIDMPCPKTSCCAFGGKELDELYITTAAKEDTAQYPQAGNTFKVELGIKGKPIYYYKY